MWYFTPLLGWAPAEAAGSKTFTCNITENQAVSAALSGRARGFATTIAETESLFPTPPNNYLYYSEEFDNAVWTKDQLTVASNTADTTDPLGTNTAEKLTDNATSSSHTITQVGGLANASQSFTVYLKPGTRTTCAIKVRCSSNDKFHTLNLSTGASTGSGGTTGTYITTSSVTSTSIGSGWYRYKVSVTFEAAGAVLFPTWEIIFANTAYSGSSQSFYAWGAQVTQGSSLPTYAKTTNIIASSSNLVRTRGLSPTITETGTKFYTVGAGVNISNQEFSSAVTQTSGVGGGVDWTNVTNARVDDGSYASVTLSAAGGAENIMFSLSDFGISPGLTITSMSCKIRIRCTRTDNYLGVFLYDPVGNIGTNAVDIFTISAANTWEVHDVDMTTILTEIGNSTDGFTTYPKLSIGTYNFASASTTDIDYIKFTLTTAGSLGPEGIATTRTRTYVYNVGETNGYTINLDVVQPFKFLEFSISEVQTNNIALNRTRQETVSIAEVMALSTIPLLRTRQETTTITENLALSTIPLLRTRNVLSTITENEAITNTMWKRLRPVVSSITEAEVISPSINLNCSFGGSIIETITLSPSLNRLKLNQTTITENMALSTIPLLRNRENGGTTITEQSALSTIPVERGRKFIMNIVEQIVHTIDFDKFIIKQFVFSVDEAESITTAFLKTRGYNLSITETEQLVSNVYRVARSYIANITQANSHGISRISRTRNLGSLSIEQVENNIIALHRLRSAILNIAEVYELADIDLLKIKILGLSITENTVIDITALNRSRKLIGLLSETTNLVLDITRTRRFIPTITQQEAITSAISLVHSLIFAVNETQTLQEAFIRNRTISGIITELENVSFNLGKLKILNMVIAETVEYGNIFVQRVRNNNLNVPELYSLYENIQRTREFILPVSEVHTLSLNVGRVREVMLTVVEEEGVDAALSRLRGIVASIEETTGYVIDIIINRDNPGSLFITLSYETWTYNAGSYSLIPLSYEFDVPLMSTGDVEFNNDNFTSTIHAIMEDVIEDVNIDDFGTSIVEII